MFVIALGSKGGGGGEYQVVDQYSIEKEADAKTIYTTFAPKVIMGLISFICIALIALKIWDYPRIVFITKHVDYIFSSVPIVIFVLMLIFLRSMPCDTWVVKMASSDIGTTFMKITTRYIILNFDVKSTRKDVNKFVQDITDRSENYNYFLIKADYTHSRIKLKSRPCVEIPLKAKLEGEVEKDEKWNYIPLGIGLTEKSGLGTVNWVLNDEEPIGVDHVEPIPSVSFLVAGGTGSGKSVVEQNLIRHVNKFHDRIMCCLVDVKRVEFGNMSHIEGINAVATTVEEAKFVLEATQAVMYSRFKFMEGEDKNNIYKIKNYKCDHFVFDAGELSHQVQFDEILFCRIDGDNVIDTADNIYKRVGDGEEVLIFLDGQKSAPVVINKQNDYIQLGQELYRPDDVVKTRQGDMTAEEAMKLIEQGQVLTVTI